MNFVDYYVKYHSLRTVGHPMFARLLAIQMLGHTFGYDCVHLIQPGEVRHNMYLALIGKSSVSKKSTTQKIARNVYPTDMTLSEDWSPEGLIGDLEEMPYGMMWYGEWTYLLKSIGSHSYMSRAVEILNLIFDCPARFKRKLKNDVYEVKEPYICINTTCTEEMLEEHIKREMMHGGFFARFLIFKGDIEPALRKRLSPKASGMHKNIEYVLRKLVAFDALNTVRFEFTDEALARYNEIQMGWYKEFEKVGSFVGRYTNYIVSIADILAISDCLAPFMCDERVSELGEFSKFSELGREKKSSSVYIPPKSTNSLVSTEGERVVNTLPNSLAIRVTDDGTEIIQIPKYYVNEAIKIIKPCLDYVNELAEYVDVMLPIRKLEKYIRKHKNVSISKAMRDTNLNADTMKLAKDTLEQQGKVYGSKETKKDRRGVKHTAQYIHWRTDDELP